MPGIDQSIAYSASNRVIFSKQIRVRVLTGQHAVRRGEVDDYLSTCLVEPIGSGEIDVDRHPEV